MINEPSDFSDLFKVNETSEVSETSENSEVSNLIVTNSEILKLFKKIVDNNFNNGKENIKSFIKKYLSSSEYDELRKIFRYIVEHEDFEIIIRMFIDNNTKLSKLDIKDFYKNYLKDDIVFKYNKKNIELKLLPFSERSRKIEEIKKMRGEYVEHMKNKKSVDKPPVINKIPLGVDYDIKTGLPFFKKNKDKEDDPEHTKQVEILKKEYETKMEENNKYHENKNVTNYANKNKENYFSFKKENKEDDEFKNIMGKTEEERKEINNERDELYNEDKIILKENINNFVSKHNKLYISEIFDKIKKYYNDDEIKILMYWYKNSKIYKGKFPNFYSKFAMIYEGDKQLVPIGLNKSNTNIIQSTYEC